MGWLSEYNLSSYLDIHQCPGVLKENLNYAEFGAAVGTSPAKIKAKDPIHIEVQNQTFVGAFFDVLMQKQISKQHRNVYYWIDYDGKPDDYSSWNKNWGAAAGLDKWKENHFYEYVLWNLWQFYKDMERRNGRGSNLAWYAGIGTQRYPLGHSGDVICSWKSLRFQPYFTSTAANVAFGYWSHDLGGHRPADTAAVSQDGELYLRWLQLGTFLPTLRTHMIHGKGGDQASRLENVWMYDELYSVPMRAAMRLRGRLVPYLYTSSLMTYRTGVSIVHPVYFDYPTEDLVYQESFKTQFLCGDNLLIAPIHEPQTIHTNLTTLEIYLPGRGDRWVEFDSLRVFEGGQLLSINYTLAERGGVFVKEGSILPMSLEPSLLRLNEPSMGTATTSLGSDAEEDGRHPFIGGATHIPKTIVWETWLGNATSGTGFVAEDNHAANAYATDFNANVAVTNASFKVASRADGGRSTIDANSFLAKSVEFDVSATTGQYQGMAPRRNHEVRLHGVGTPSAVHVLSNGNSSTRLLLRRKPRTRCGKFRCSCGIGGDENDVEYSEGGWWWDAATLTAYARVDDVDATNGVSLRFDFESTVHGAGFPSMLQRALTIKNQIDKEAHAGTLPSIALNRLAATADRVQVDPSTAVAEMAAFGEHVRAVVALHTGGSNMTSEKGAGLPSTKLQILLRAWLSPPTEEGV
jgi:hypothetical protein